MLATLMTFAGALRFRRSSRRFVSRKGARWLTAKVRSIPSSVTSRFGLAEPALLTRMWSFGWLDMTPAANARTWLNEAKSQNIRETASERERLFTADNA